MLFFATAMAAAGNTSLTKCFYVFVQLLEQPQKLVLFKYFDCWRRPCCRCSVDNFRFGCGINAGGSSHMTLKCQITANHVLMLMADFTFSPQLVCWKCFNELNIPWTAWNRCSFERYDGATVAMASHYFPTVLSAIVPNLALVFSAHITAMHFCKWKNYYFSQRLEFEYGIQNWDWLGPNYLLFCYVNRFIQYYPHGAFPAAGMCCRSFVCHKCIRIWY